MPGLVKIGRARNPQRRLAAANTWCPRKGFTLVGAVSFTNAHVAERVVHHRLADQARGGEWFHLREGQNPMEILRHVRRMEKARL